MTNDLDPRSRHDSSDSSPRLDEAQVAVTLGEGVAALAASRGGVIYLSLRESRCCSGSLTFLDADTSPTASRPTLRAWSVEGVDVRLVTPIRRFPREINIELRGRRRPKLVAFFDGCAFRL